MAIKGSVVGSIRKLRTAVKKGSGAGYLQRFKTDVENQYRFIEEPEHWVSYLEHYDAVRKFYPCADDCPGCAEGDNPSNKFLANAVEVATGNVVPLVLPKSVAAAITKFYDKFNTIMDRDYVVDREGSGLDTEYQVYPEPPSKVKGGLDQFEPLDLMSLLEAQVATDDDDDDDEEDEAPRRGARPTRSSGASKVKRRRPEPEDDDDEDEDDEPPARTRRPMKKPGAARAAKESAVQDRAVRRKSHVTEKAAPAVRRKPIRRK